MERSPQLDYCCTRTARSPERASNILTPAAPTKGSRPRIAEEHDGVSSLISAIEAGSGIALMPESLACIAGARLKLLPLTPAPESLVIGLVSVKAGLRAAVERFSQCAKDAVFGKRRLNERHDFLPSRVRREF